MDNSSFSNSNQTSAIEENGKNILIIILDSLILLLSLSGNSLVVYTISKERKLQTTCNYLLLNLAICDIIVVSLGTSIDIMLQFTKSKWILGMAMCRTLSPAMTLFYISGSLILVVISLDRYKMFVHPLRARYQRKHVKYAVVVVHSISFMCVLPFAVFSTITDGYCYDVWPAIWYRKGYTVFLFVMQYALPLLIMGVAYAGVSLSLLRSKSAFKKNSDSGGCREKRETTPVKSLVGAVSSSSPSHSKNDVNLVTEQHEMAARPRPLPLGLGGKRAQSYSGELPECDAKGSCIGCVHICSRKRHTRTEESIVVGGCEITENFTSKADEPNRCQVFIPCHERELSDYSYLIGKSQTESTSNGQKSTVPLEYRLEQANNNVEAHTCGKATFSAPSKRRFSDRLPSYRRNAIRRRIAGASSKSRNSRTPSMRDKRNNHALMMILLVVVVFTLFMLPMQIMSLLLDFAGKPTAEKYKIYAWFVMCSYFGSCTLNPFIYGLVDRTFRAGFKKFGKKVASLCRFRASQD